MAGTGGIPGIAPFGDVQPGIPAGLPADRFPIHPGDGVEEN